MIQPVFVMRDTVKAFPGVLALDRVSFSCMAGQVHALVGENGAGKSTLIKILSGAYQPDSGTIQLDAKTVKFSHPVDSLRSGISVIYQELSLLPDRTVAENIFLGREPVRRGIIDTAGMHARTREVLGMFGTVHHIEPDILAGDLHIAEQQMVEIAKAMSLDAKVIIMDEPTAALNEQECEALFGLVDKLRNQGRAVVYITHRMHEVERLADRVTVLKDGKVAAKFASVPQPGEIIRAMVGRDIGDYYPEPAKAGDIGDTVLSVQGGTNARLRDINLGLRSGEIVGFAGLQGSGRAALALALIGDEPFILGTIALNGEKKRLRHPREAINAGIGMLPGDRKAEGLLLMQSVRDNGMVCARALSSLLGLAAKTQAGDITRIDGLLQELDVKATGLDQEIQFLSGGNQQKVIVARWLLLAPKVLVFVEPTRGIDVKAKAGIYRLMRDLAREGAAVMMISSDLPEILGAADRVLVMRDGTIAAEFPRGVSEAEIMQAATGNQFTAGAA